MLGMWCSSAICMYCTMHCLADAPCCGQVCRNGIVHIAWHPGSDRLLVACSDKSGHVGLWDVNHSPVALEGLLPTCKHHMS